MTPYQFGMKVAADLNLKAQPAAAAMPKPARPQALQQAGQPAATPAVGFNKPNDHYYLPPDQHGFAYGPRGGAPSYYGGPRDWAKSPAHAQYIERVRKQYPYAYRGGDEDPNKLVQSFRRPAEYVDGQPRYRTIDEQERAWQDFVDAHPVAENFTAPKPTWFGDNAAALNRAREQALQAELPTPVAPRGQPAPAGSNMLQRMFQGQNQAR